MDSDDEKEKRPKKQRKPRSEAPSGDEAEHPKKKRRGKLKKASSEQPEGDDEPMFSDAEELQKPKKVLVHHVLLNVVSYSSSDPRQRRDLFVTKTMKTRLHHAKSTTCTCQMIFQL